MTLALVVSGAAATGKSTLGSLLARDLGAALIDLDTATGPLVSVVAGLIGTDDLGDPRLVALVRTARYETVAALAEDSLRVGTPVVVVAPFTRERRDPDAWQAFASRLTVAGAEPHLVWLSLPADVAVVRMRRRGAARDQNKVADVPAYLEGLDLTPPQVPHLLVHGELSTADQVSAVRAAF